MCTVPIYFRVISTSFVGTGNPAQDTIKNAVEIQSVNAKPKLEFTPDLHGQVAPLGTVVYRHLLTNPAATDLRGAMVLSSTIVSLALTVYYFWMSMGMASSAVGI